MTYVAIGDKTMYLVVRVEQSEHVAALHGDLTRRLLRIVVQRDHALLAGHVHYR